MDDLKRYIREVPDYPKPGINFYDITTLLKDKEGFRLTLDRFHELFADQQIDKVVGMESRGFLFGPSLAYDIGAGFVPVRKPGKLPAAIHSQSYDLEYGTDCLEMHRDAIEPGERILIVDDVIATGGTAAAAGALVQACGGDIVGYGFIIELTFLNGRQRLAGTPVSALLTY